MYGWFGDKNSLRAWINVFPETFRLGEVARLHIHVIGTEHLKPEIDTIEINLTLSANRGNYKFSCHPTFPINRGKQRDVYILQILPWGCAKDSYTEAGPAEMNIDIFAKSENTDIVQNTTNTGNVTPLHIESIPLTILPPTSKLRYGIPGNTCIFKELTLLKENNQFISDNNHFLLKEVGDSKHIIKGKTSYAIMEYIYDPYITLIALDDNGKEYAPQPSNTGHILPPQKITDRFDFLIPKENISHFILLENTRKYYDKIKKGGESQR